MSYGFRVWDAAGNLTLDLSTRCGRIIGIGDPGPNDGTWNIPEFAQGIPFTAFLNPNAITEFVSGQQVYGYPIVSVSGTTLSWTYQRGGVFGPVVYQGALIAYGVF